VQQASRLYRLKEYNSLDTWQTVISSLYKSGNVAWFLSVVSTFQILFGDSVISLWFYIQNHIHESDSGDAKILKANREKSTCVWRVSF